MMFCVLLTFWLSVLIRAFAWVMLLRTQGLINTGLQELGLIDQPLRLVRNEFGVIVGMVHFMLPLAVLPIYSNMTGIQDRLVSAARGLGASPWVAFKDVYLPLSQARPDRRDHSGLRVLSRLLHHPGPCSAAARW